MAIGSSVLLAKQIKKRRAEEKSFWEKSFLILGIDATKWYVSRKQSILCKIGAWLGIYSTLVGAIAALAQFEGKPSKETASA